MAFAFNKFGMLLQNMNGHWGKVVAFSRKYPLSRGMASYALIWPVSSLCQQTIAGKKEYDFKQALRFSLFGAFFVAPTLYTWFRVATSMFPGTTLKSAVSKAIVEQLTYGPSACVCFFFGMSLLEGKTIEDAVLEVKTKFIPTYKYGVLCWPIATTINFIFIPPRNRVPFISLCSFVWTNFLAYMKELEAKKLLEQQRLKRQNKLLQKQQL